jgi:hypothetical protein
MMKFFKRPDIDLSSFANAPAAGSRLPDSVRERRRFPRPMPLPEVIEGNGGETDWALWEEAKQGQTKPTKA